MKHVFPPIQFTYTTNAEYRASLRTICNMDINKYHENVNFLPNMDTETLDEYNYDEQQFSVFIDRVIHSTIHIREFQILYTYAAGLMFSEDPEIGITILLSYDYLHWFYPLLYEYTNAQYDHFDFQSNTYYKQIYEKLTK
jgi:hypothetical protein